MLKIIALAAVGAFIATPAIAGPGIVFQGKNLNGIKLQGVSTHGVALEGTTQPQRPPAPKLPAFDAELAGKPVQTACASGCGGIKFNGRSLNGLKWNGITFNGTKLNGIKLQGRTLNGVKLQGWSLNGAKLNGKFLNGTATGAREMAERDASFNVRAVTLPDGKRIVVR